MFQGIRQLSLAVLLGVTVSTTFSCGLRSTKSPEESLTAGEKTALHAARTLLIVKRTVTEAHRVFWSAPLRERAEVCDKPTRAETLACLEPYTPETNAKLVAGLEAYEAAATLAGTAIIAGHDKPITDSLLSVTQAAVRLVGLFPKASVAAATLEALLGAI